MTQLPRTIVLDAPETTVPRFGSFALAVVVALNQRVARATTTAGATARPSPSPLECD